MKHRIGTPLQPAAHAYGGPAWRGVKWVGQVLDIAPDGTLSAQNAQ